MPSYVNYAFLGELCLLALNLRRQLGSDFLHAESHHPVFQIRLPTPASWDARRAPMECLLGPCGAAPLERHSAELTVHGVEVSVPSIPRATDPRATRHPLETAHSQ